METKGIDYSAIPQTALRVLTQPALFFREMPKTGGFIEPLVFMVAMGVVSGIIGGLLTALFSLLGLHVGAGMVTGFIAIILMPLYYAIGSAVFGFVSAAILFIIWKIMGSNEEYETAYRCNAYVSAVLPFTTVLAMIPYLGGAIGVLIGIYYLVHASIHTHGIPSRKAWLVFGIIAAVLVIFQISAQIAARRASHNLDKATESWKETSEQMQKAAEEMQKQMQQDMEKKD
jgi:hypothetical protein